MASSHGQLSRSVFVTGLPITECKLKVKQHFEDETNGGGHIEHIASDAYGSWNTTMIEFEGKEAAKQVLEKQHKIKGTVVTVIPIQTCDESSISAVVVTGLPRYSCRHDIKKYFEDKKHGGGSINDITCTSSGASWNSTIIEFQSVEVAHRVLEIYHEIFQTTVKVIPLQSKTPQVGATANRDLQTPKICATVNRDLQVCAIANRDLQTPKVGAAANRDLQAKRPSVPVDRSILVTNLSQYTKEQIVKTYLEDKANGGGPVEDVIWQFNGKNTMIIVVFKDKEVTKSFVEKKHKVDYYSVQIFPLQFQHKHIFKSYDFEKGELTINDAWQKTLSLQQWMDVSHNIEGYKYQSGCYTVRCSFGEVTEVKNILQQQWVKVIASVLTIEADTVNSDDGQSDEEVAASKLTTRHKPSVAKAGQDTSPLEEQNTYITSHDEGRQSRHDTGQGEGHDAARSMESYTTASNSSLDSSWSTLSLPQEVRESLGPNVKDKFIWGLVEKTRNHQVEKIKKMHHVSIRTITNHSDDEEILVEARSNNEPKDGSKVGYDEVSTIHPEAQKKIDNLYKQIEQGCSFHEVKSKGIEENMLLTALCELEQMHTNVVISSNGQIVTLAGEKTCAVSAKGDLEHLLAKNPLKKGDMPMKKPGVAVQQAPPPICAGGSMTTPTSQSYASVASRSGENKINNKPPEANSLDFSVKNWQDIENSPPNKQTSPYEIRGDQPSSQDCHCADNQSKAGGTKKDEADKVPGPKDLDDSPIVHDAQKPKKPKTPRVV